jgi:hypothetical protein
VSWVGEGKGGRVYPRLAPVMSTDFMFSIGDLM